MRRRYVRLMLVLAALLLLNGCAILREFRPAVTVEAMTPGEYIALKRGDILTSGQFSAATTETIRSTGLDSEGTCADLGGQQCIDALADVAGLSNERRLSALSELWLHRAQALSVAARPEASGDGDPRLDAWLEVARHAYAYLFFSERAADTRAFEDRQTQVRDYYNVAVQEAASLLFVRYRDGQAFSGDGVLADSKWRVRIALPDGESRSGYLAMPQELLPASSLSFAGLRSTFRRDGFGGELVAVMASDPVTTMPVTSTAAAEDEHSLERSPAWSEMPASAVTALLQFPGDDLAQVLSAREARLTTHDPYRESRVELHGQEVPLSANFTAGYGLWLARSGFNRQSLRSLLGRERGIDRPHLYLMQPYDPDRRVIVMVHGLASSPEAWVNVANELMGDEEIRQHFQVWQFYYPTNLPIAYNQDAMRRTLEGALRHFDPDGVKAASHDLVLIGHSMGGVISRLMVSSSGEDLWDQLVADRHMDASREQRVRKRIGPMLRFEPVPGVERVIFIAAPHRGTEVAGGRMARWIGRMVRLPLTLFENFGDVLDDLAHGGREQGRDARPKLPNSIDNLDRSDPFVQAAANLPISPCVSYHSIIGQPDPKVPLAQSDDGLVPYWSAHLEGAVSEKVVRSAHSVQETAPAILEMRRILHEDIAERAGRSFASSAAEERAGCRD